MNDVSTLAFETALAELERIVAALERGDVPLAQAVETYERGIALKNHCEGLLRQAQMRIDQVVLTPAGAAERLSSFES